MPKNTLIPIYLPDGQIILAKQGKDSSYHIYGFENEVSLSGAFAESLASFLNKTASENDLKRLKQLEKHDWLFGLSRASTTPSITPQQQLIGSELGMLFIELTDQCNERCIHCYADSSPERNDFLPLKHIYSALDQAIEYGTPYLQFTGGDPLIHPHLIEAVEYASDLPFKGIEIYTNGLLLNDKLLEKFIPFKPSFSFSIYADSAEIHDAISMVPGSWKRTLDAMKRAKDAGLKIRAGMVLMEQNIQCAERMPAFLNQELGMDANQIRFDAVNQVGRGKALNMLQGITPSHSPSSGPDRKGKLCIAANGDVYPCVFARNFKLGNIAKHSLNDIFSTLQHREPDESDSKRWNSCCEQLSCGDCRIIAYTTHSG
ncbi:MAG: radical SAM protein [Mariprofundaceae bacterium]